jgi:hypothetical protein
MGALVDKFLYRNSFFMVWKNTSTGLAAGQVADPDNVSSASVSISGALILPTIISSGAMGVTRATYGETSGGEKKLSIDGGVESTAPFPVVLGRETSTLYYLMSGVGTVNVDTSGTVGTVTMGGKDIAPNTLNNLGCAVITNSAHRSSTGVYTAGKWSAKIYPSVTIAPQDTESNQNTGDNPMSSTVIVTPSKTTTAPWGELFSAMTGLAFTNNESFMLPYDAPYPFYISVATMDGTGTGFTLPYKPAYSDAAITGRNQFFLNGTRTAVTSCSTSTGAVVIAAAGSAGDKWRCVTPLSMPITAT